ncbi:hypothetical protein GA0115234_105181 [Streptomyces sp. DvalAA-43]|nr:hypothetical protein GA0115234_105181 [Streptomyces sp. DvalAA-43]
MTAQASVAGPVPPPERQITDSMIWWAPSSSGRAASGGSRARRTRATHTAPMAAMPVPATRSAVALQDMCPPWARQHATGIGHFGTPRHGSGDGHRR